MASTSSVRLFALALLISLLACNVTAQLSPSFYSYSCPNLQGIVRRNMNQALAEEERLGASILRLFFHDCFVQGCDASVLLDDTSSFTGEKTAFPNRNSIRGFEVLDAIKSNVEASCKETVSCADILALAARDGVFLLGGPSWDVPLGRRDSMTASLSLANSNLPAPSSDLATLISKFANQGLNAQDMTALSGAHTIGQARCTTFRPHIYNDTDINPRFASSRQQTCPLTGEDDNLAPIDIQTPTLFGNDYYQNLLSQRGLFHSDQELFNGGSQDLLVRQYASNGRRFASDFVTAMIKMGNISPLTGSNGQIRLNCRKIN